MNITGHNVEKVDDTTGILTGDRFEFIINVEVDEDDELYSENGLFIKVIFAVIENEKKILHYDIYERTTNNFVDFALEEDEEKMLLDYCVQHVE